MVRNNISVRRKEVGVAQRQIAERMEGVSVPVFSAIENGSVMPTRESMKALCEVLQCEPDDLYDPEELDLTLMKPVELTDAMPVEPTGDDRGHPGQIEFRAWLRLSENTALKDALSNLGYRSSAEWIREMIRNTVARHRRISNGSAR